MVRLFFFFMSRAKKTLIALAEFNSWRRGDESLDIPSPAEIGAIIDDAVNLLREYDELEHENDRMREEVVTLQRALRAAAEEYSID